jgi:hypothetical protein
MKKKVRQPAAQDALCRWLEAEFGAGRIILVQNDVTPDHKRSRLWIICETQAGADSFHKTDGSFYGRDPEKEAKVLEYAQKNGLLIHSDKSSGHKPFIATAAFEPIARSEALSRLRQKELDKVVQKFSKKGVWLVRRSFHVFIVMFMIEDDRRLAARDGTNEDIHERLKRLVLRHDEFGYVRNGGLDIRFDSKEVFDRDYAGSWFNYER